VSDAHCRHIRSVRPSHRSRTIGVPDSDPVPATPKTPASWCFPCWPGFPRPSLRGALDVRLFHGCSIWGTVVVGLNEERDPADW